MNLSLLGSGLLNCIKPYCRKHVISSLDSHEFMFLNTFLISFSLIIYLMYLIYMEKTSSTDLYNKYTNLSTTQVVSAISFSLITVTGTILIINVDKKFGFELV